MNSRLIVLGSKLAFRSSPRMFTTSTARFKKEVEGMRFIFTIFTFCTSYKSAKNIYLNLGTSHQKSKTCFFCFE